MGVTDSRVRGNNRWRRRRCADCAHRFTTIEVSEGRYRELEQLAAARDQLTAALTGMVGALERQARHERGDS